MMPDPEQPTAQKVEGLVEAARQRLTLALTRETWLRRSEYVERADELLAEVQRLLRSPV